ncbi:Pre-mRNA-splicing factor ISY1-like [Hondaea fermentalgiana]|uniref:Pre-mRNA-splicing factor ISY1-like n=1 Tax=Hondaea fermentalgiana TaxID=2315210 RepID=A0A2R5GC96_9STRA|nr:Pre-mRNA-splicing factor ISY1-like [Hondaea fermentalgiana]|eukprot:GBG25781.1 Pre-mRNA-splicing factor ISY1-like [Hondaea fermentalgiana]
MSRRKVVQMGTLNRWMSFQQQVRLGQDQKDRSKNPESCKNLDDAHRFRRAVMREISQKLTQVQMASLGEHRLRELNDEINKLMRERFAWERQILKLGGPDLRNHASSGKTYKYFGAARELPQVRELLARPEVKPAVSKKRKRDDIMRTITPAYYHSVDDTRDDPMGLLDAEAREESEIRAERIAEEEPIPPNAEQEAAEAAEKLEASASPFEQLMLRTAHYSSLSFLSVEQRKDLDTSKAMEKVIVERKRKELMDKYLL